MGNRSLSNRQTSSRIVLEGPAETVVPRYARSSRDSGLLFIVLSVKNDKNAAPIQGAAREGNVSIMVQDFKHYTAWRQAVVAALENDQRWVASAELTDAATNQRIARALARLADDK